jgi:hypothetical protein
MSNHVTEWLNAYLDDELKNGRLHQVEKHLAECTECQAELESLQNYIVREIRIPGQPPSSARTAPGDETQSAGDGMVDDTGQPSPSLGSHRHLRSGQWSGLDSGQTRHFEFGRYSNLAGDKFVQRNRLVGNAWRIRTPERRQPAMG